MAPPVVVAIPARNEAADIAACLHALARQPAAAQHMAAVVVFANNCSDATAAVARSVPMPCALLVVEAALPAAHAHIGHARRGATDAAMAWLHDHAHSDGIIACTDADSIVAPDWLAQLRLAFGDQIDAVCGEIDLPGPLPPALRSARRAEAHYAACTAQVAATLDPLAHDPWPHHIWSWGANLAVRAAVLARIGGTPLVDLAEDRALHAQLLAHDARIRHACDVRVATSARRDGRAPGGFADLLADYAGNPDVLADFALEPAAMTWRRARLRGAARRQWGTAPGFGAHWAAHEQHRLPRQRVALADLPAQTRLLQHWLRRAADRCDNPASAIAIPRAHRRTAPQ